MQMYELPIKKRMYLLSKAVESVENGVIITDKNGTIMYANPSASEITGYSNEELIGQNPRLFKSDKHSLEFYEKLWKKIESGKKWTGEIINKRKNGELWTESLVIIPVTDENGSAEFYIGIQADASKQKNIQKKLRKTTEELKKFIENKKIN